jgi:predicted PurR-regulated permease PerM
MEGHSENYSPKPLESAFVDLLIRLGFLGLLANWSLLLVRPFLTVVIGSAVLAAALFPVFDWIATRLGARRKLAALLLTILNLLIVTGPVTWLGLGLIENLHTLAERLDAGTLSVPPPFEAVKGWPLVGEQVYEIWYLASTDLKAAFTNVAPQLKPIGGRLLGMAGSAGLDALKFIASVIIAGFLFIQGPSLVSTVNALSRRIDAKRGEAFVALAGATIRNVSRDVIGISMLQALLAGIGLMTASIPAAGLLTLTVLVFGIIQIGASIILIPVIILSWTAMDTTTAMIFSAYMVPVTLLDNVLRPIVMAHGLTTPMVVILVGVIGGTIAHGVIGLFVGPIVLAVGWELLVAWIRDGQSASATASGSGTPQ